MTRYTNRLRPLAPGTRMPVKAKPSQRATDRGRGPGLPSINTGALRTRWTVYNATSINEPIPVNLNCWRATVYFTNLDISKPLWNGIDIGGMFPGASIDAFLTVVVGGAMFDERPVYLNEVNYFAGEASRILVVEEFFDPAVKPNN